MSGDQRPGGPVPGIGWVALLGDLADDDIARGSVGGEVCAAVGLWPTDAAPVIVTRWADGTTPTAPSGHNDGERVWQPSEFVRCDKCDRHGHLGLILCEACTPADPAPSPDTVTVPKAEWDALVEAVDKGAGRMGHRWIVPIGDRAVALIGASRRAAGAVR